MLKTIILSKNSTFQWLRIGNCKISKYSISSDKKIAKKLRKLKNKKLSKFLKLAKSGKKL